MVKSNVVFLPIGENQCGDAIAVRLWDSEDPSNQRVILIDGGYRNDWEKAVDLVKLKFKSDKIDLVVSTHMDSDHIGGLPGVLENIQVDNLWMHLPWEHSSDFLASRQSEFNELTATKKLKASLSKSNDLALAAEAAGLTPEEPFTGKQFVTDLGTLTVLGPTKEYYEELLPQILDNSAKAANAASSQQTTAMKLSDLAKLMGTKVSDAVKNVFESHDVETLSNNGDTTPSNNTSTVMLLELADGSKKLLFTGDSGKRGLNEAFEVYQASGHRSGELAFVQVPHHGSRRNVGPEVLDKFLGTRTDNPDTQRGTAYVSAVENCTKHGHPKKSATNAFRRRGYPVFQTGKTSLKHGHELDGFTGTVYPLPLYDTVEPDD